MTPEEKSLYNKRYRELNREKLKEHSKNYYHNNKDKHKKWWDEYYLKNRDKILRHQNKPEIKESVWENRIKRMYNVDSEWYYNRLNEQNNKCEICESSNPGNSNNKFCIDHFELEGKVHVRGLLCIDCNAAIGKFKHNSSLLIKAANYCNKQIG